MEEGLVILEGKEGTEEAKVHQQFLQEYKQRRRKCSV